MSCGEGFVWKRRGMSSEDQMDETSSITSKIMIMSNKSTKKKKNQKKKMNKMRETNAAKSGGCSSCDLVSFDELPEYMKDNEFIRDYYRADWSLKQALFSIFRWHNETLNVWTHLIGFVLFVGLTCSNLMHVLPVDQLLNIFTTWSFPLGPEDTTEFIDLKHSSSLGMQMTPTKLEATRWPFFVFLGGSMFCLLSSSICHLFSCHSHPLNVLLLRIDYVGITVMIITSFFPPIYYIFQCTPHWQFLYLGGITVMGIFTIITLLSPVFSTSKFRAFRASLFVGMGLFGLIPAVHAMLVNWHEPSRNIILGYELAMALSYLIGTVFYVSRIPERWRPGWFDLAGHSHQIFHVFVIMGALSHYGAALVFLDFRSKIGCEVNM
ncbi:heptahelical transmembrane protein 1 isoform X2 [Daucus carota subsp. sativus]|uniref:heptahelical transmembrane protein 1 isoform X2 n=1 Tax=Daucus carota subsp. sativus TaxID=79200 RepID=UPI0007F00648|nr:PREDICTED: heptahelical transmembrane protein 1 isoform X2 [Daucus carota subsp. sativus]